ncbi:hypothetical protein LMG24235_07133 [Paraburkholderia sabiae]|nr:hypothetical protein LMG24235_07133 [Paraburkholderia sabiae]
MSATLVAGFGFCFLLFAAALASAISYLYFMRRPCAGRHLLFFAAAKKSRQKKAASNLRCRPGSRCGIRSLSCRAATQTLRRKPAVRHARREKLNPLGAHSVGLFLRVCRRFDCGGMCSRPCGVFAPCAVDCGLSTACERCCATARLRHAEASSWQAPEVQKRLSFAYFSLPLQRKVGAAPHRGNA